MLHDIKELEGCAVGATDGDLGTVKDLYFDDQRWAVRYLVVETGGWLSRRKVLVSPSAVRRVDLDNGVIDVRLTRQQVRDSPDFDADKPVSRQHEIDYYDFHGYPYYWHGTNLWGLMMYPMSSVEPSSRPPSAAACADDEPTADHGPLPGDGEAGDSHLRSTNDVIGHEAMASDGAIGSVRSFVFDDVSWAIRDVVVDTGNWLPGKRVLLSPERIQRISWPDRRVFVGMTRQEVRASPEYVHQLVPTYQIRE